MISVGPGSEAFIQDQSAIQETVNQPLNDRSISIIPQPYPSSRMATSILPSGHSHFNQGPQYYTQNVYHDFNQPNPAIASPHSQFPISNTPEDAMAFATSPAWPNQMNGRRASSKSPNANERTPIRHNRVNSSRTRSSTSGSEALLAYATGQSLQQQQPQTIENPTLLEHTRTLSSPLFSSPTFSPMSSASPFLQQHGFYDNATTGFHDLQTQPTNHGMPNYYATARTDMHTSPMTATGLSPQEAMYMQQTNQTRSAATTNMSSQGLSFPPMARSLETSPTNVEVSSSRNKPQCWDHGCNGRQFSTFSNLLRHQREKSGTAAKARCPHCGTEFTRTTARNGHMYGGKCKGIPDASKRSSISDSIDYSE